MKKEKYTYVDTLMCIPTPLTKEQYNNYLKHFDILTKLTITTEHPVEHTQKTYETTNFYEIAHHFRVRGSSIILTKFIAKQGYTFKLGDINEN